MTIRNDRVFAASVMFTIALGCLIPSTFASASLGRAALQEPGPAWGTISKLSQQLGLASLVIVVIGLIVTWTGYVKTVRWTWFIMFLIVWGWAFPLMILPLFLGSLPSVSVWFRAALSGPGIPRDFLLQIFIFLLLLAALFMPIKQFLWIDAGRSAKPSGSH